jgi:hypothetical protein
LLIDAHGQIGEVCNQKGLGCMKFGIVWRLRASIAALIALFALSACGERGQTDVWRQKLILDVETPGGLVSGGSVVEVTVHWFSGLEKSVSNGTAAANSSKGEASFVEVAPGKYLFALSVNEPVSRTLKTFHNGDELQTKDGTKIITSRLPALRETRVLPLGLYPDLVTFDDINDPKTVKLVDPANLAASFGPGFSLKGVKLEITGERVTEGAIAGVLPWENSLVGSIGKGMNLPYRHILNQINDGSFSIGTSK